jgi:hypothetical protein
VLYPEGVPLCPFDAVARAVGGRRHR